MEPRNGIFVLIVLLFVLPWLADFVLFLFLNKSLINWNMTKMMFAGYLGFLPIFILYLIIAFGILYLIKQYRKNRSNKE